MHQDCIPIPCVLGHGHRVPPLALGGLGGDTLRYVGIIWFILNVPKLLPLRFTQQKLQTYNEA